MAEGLNKAIELKGIARNTAPSTCQDGELEEIINLRFKDGSWKPVGELENMGSVGQHTELYVHTNLYHHVLGVEDGALYWFANIEDGKVVNLDTPIEIAKVTGEISIKQTGHLITIIDGEGLTYSLFNTQKDEYVTINADFNGKQTDISLIPEGLIDFRVTAEVDEYGRPLYSQVEEIAEDLFKNGEEITQDDINKAGRYFEPIVDKAYSLSRETKYLSEGYYMLTYALELYDGNYILQSRPILLAPPYVNKEGWQEYTVGSIVNGVLEENKNVCEELSVDENVNLNMLSNDWFKFNEGESPKTSISTIVWRFFNDNIPTDFKYPTIHPTIDADDKAKAFDKTRFFDITTIKDANDYLKRTFATNVKGYKPIIMNLNDSANAYVYLAHNKLQLRVNSIINKHYRDIIKGISVFITKPIRVYNFNNDADFRYAKGQYSAEYEIYPVYRDKKEIIEELKKCSSFYKIKSYTLEELPQSGEWVDVEIEEGLLSVLTEQERLTIDNFSRNSYVPKTTFSYNGRLHLANYTSDMFRGFPLNYFFGHNAEGQWEIKEKELIRDKGESLWYVDVEIETNEGVSTVVRHAIAQGEDKFYSLNPILSYPDSRAKKMTIVTYSDGTTLQPTGFYKGEFALTPHPYFNFAYYIDAELKPIELSFFTVDPTNPIPIPKEKNTQENKNNCVKVSSVDNPFYFPVANTYQIGNSEIIGFATNTIALSTGQAGDAPLYVFTKDGIYALFVDASGQLTYTNSRPIARDICNNPKSITPIDDGVLFTTDRGLMLLSGSEVIDMSDIAEGVPFDLSSVPEIDACVNCSQLVELKNNTSKENFLEYIKGAVIGYNYFDKEIWISNPTKTYSYVYNIRVKGWTKRTESAKELVGDYPYVYMLDENKDLRNISKEIVGLTETMFLTRPIKLQTQEFKQGYRTIIRSLLDGDLDSLDWKVIYPSTDAEPLPIEDGDYIELVSLTGDRYRFIYRGGEILYSTLLDNVEKGEYLIIPQSCYCGIYLFGSYDCRKWALIGARERDGVIRDLGLLSHRVDCKYFRLLFVGKLKEGSTIEYVEMSAEARLLADKIR